MSNTDTAENPRAVMGDNLPDYGQIAADRMAEHYSGTATEVEELLAEARLIPQTIEDDEMMGNAAALVKRIRDAATKLEAYHGKEKEPFLRGGQAVDSFFFSSIEKLKRRLKTGKAGAADILHARVDDYQQRKLAAERARLQRIREEEERAAEVARKAAIAAAKKAEDDRLAADRARNPEKIAAKDEVAKQAEIVADEKRVDAAVANTKVDEAVANSKASSADIVRTRTDGGVLATMRQEPHVEIVNVMLLDKNAIWPFLKEDEVLRALKAYAKTTNHKKPMDGAIIEMRDKTVIR